jgi:hypothetical protein
MKAPTAARLVWSIWATTLMLIVAALALAAANPGGLPIGYAGLAVAFLSFATVGALVGSRRPGNAVGWICCAIGLSVALAVAPLEYVRYAVAHPGSLPAAAWIGWPAMWAWFPAQGLMSTFLLLVFPTGHLPSRRWRPVVWAAGATITGVSLVAAVAPEPLDAGLPPNPLGIQQLAAVYEVVGPIAFLLLGVLGLASVVSLVVRFRRARGEERQQLKWFTYGAGVLTLLLAVSAVSPALNAQVPNLVVAAALAAPPLAIGVAVLRYRLYDIDRIINRTLVYGLLTATLGLAYAGVVLVLGQLFGEAGGNPPSWAVAGATLTAAALFQPARRRIQQAVDRRFNRRKYNAAMTIELFSARLREQVDLDTLSVELLAVVDQTMQPTAASLWLRPSAQTPTGGEGRGRYPNRHA